MKRESDLMKKISQRLSIYQMTGEVEWYGRLNSLKVKTIYGGIVQGLPKGTPDYIAIIRNKQDNLTILFIEAKSDVGKLRQEQKDFKHKYETKSGFMVSVIREISELDAIINSIGKDFVANLPDSFYWRRSQKNCR